MTANNDNNTSNKKFRMVALDLDGTLLNSNHNLSDATIAHLRQLHAKGFLISIATGRSAACTAHIIEKLDLSDPLPLPPPSAVVDINDVSLGFPLVCTNGARGLRICKSHSDVGHSSSSKDCLATNNDNKNSAPHRSNTVPLVGTNSSDININNNAMNPFLKRTLIINQEIFHNPLSPSLTLKTLALAHRLGCVTNYYQNHHIYAVVRNEEQLELTKRYGTLTGSADLYCYLNDKEENEPTSTLYNEENGYGYRKAMELGPPSKLLILCDTAKLDEITNLVRTELNGTSSTENDAAATQQQAHVIRGTPPFFVEILHPTVNKGQGLRQLCQSLSIPLEEVIAFGDGDNDLEFIQMAGWGVAMKNARGVVKEAADEVAGWSNDEDGVVRTLQRYEQEGKLHFPNETKE